MATNFPALSRRSLLKGIGLGSAAAVAARSRPLGLAGIRPAGAQERRLEKVAIALGADPRTLMHNAIVDWTAVVQIEHIYEPALLHDPTEEYRIGPWLTTLANLDELTWELKLVKPDLTFHNGHVLDASAFKAAIDWAKDPAHESHYLERWEVMSEVTVVDPQTLRIKTAEPFPIIDQRLREVHPIDPKYLQEVGAEKMAEQPIGTGPFKFVEWKRGERLVLERNPYYWHNRLQVDRVEFRFIPEFSSRLSALLAEEIEIVKDVPVDSIDTVKNSGVARIEAIPSSRVNYVALVNNREDSVLNDVRIRRAINYGVDVDAIIDGVFQGQATRMAGPLSQLNPDVNPEIKPYPYDPEKAQALLKEAGYEPGQLEIVMDAPQGRYPMDTDAAQAIAASLGAIGINVQVQYNEWGTHLDKIVNRRTGDMFYLGWGPALEAYGTLAFLFVGESTYSGYTNPEVEAKIAEASKTVDPAARRQLWNDVQQMVYDDAGWLFLWQQHDIYGVANKVAWTPRPDEFLWMGDAGPQAE